MSRPSPSGIGEIERTLRTRNKVLLTIIAATLFWLAGNALGCYGVSEEKRIDKFAPCESALIAAYQKFNEDYFYGNLPTHQTDVFLGDLSAFEDMGRIDYKGNRWVIMIDPQMHRTEKQAEMTLIHEMCHQESEIAEANEGLDGHSYAFEACMESIANRKGFKNLW